MKTGERVIWFHSPKRSILKGWRIQRIPGVIVGFTRRRVRIRAWHRGMERIVRVHFDNLLCGDEDFTTDLTDFTEPPAIPAKSVRSVAALSDEENIHERD